MKPILKKSELLKLIDEGYTRPQLAEHFQISVQELRKITKEFGILNKAKKRSYQLVDDIKDGTTSSTVTQNPALYTSSDELTSLSNH